MPPSRVVNVSSDAGNGSRMDFDNLQGEREYNMLRAYGQSKLVLNILTFEVSQRLEGTDVTANFLYPGAVKTNLVHDLNPLAKAIFSIVKLFFARPKNGAKTSIYLASSPDVENVSREYFVNGREARAPEGSFDEQTAKLLWQRCGELAGPDPMKSAESASA